VSSHSTPIVGDVKEETGSRTMALIRQASSETP